MRSFFRFAGGKSKLSKLIARIIFDRFGAISDYREPFFGGGSVGLEVMEHLGPGAKVWINDKDDALMSIWQAVVENPHSITDPTMGYEPRLKDFYEFKYRLMDHDDKSSPQDRAIMHLVMRQISRSGLGVMSGGPMGGRSQKSKDCKINARWSPNAMSKKIMQAHKLFSKFQVKFTSLDYADVLKGVTEDSVVYLDPPYRQKGHQLYQVQFSKEEHIKLAGMLKKLDCKWFLSYDNCQEVRELYDWAEIIQIPVSYTLNNTGRAVELLIMPRLEAE
jgi:DNA adenine methylase